MNYFPKRSKWIFLFCLLAVSFIYGYHKILFLRPQSSHQWRQSDCLSFAFNYYKGNARFSEPELLFQTERGSAKAIGEFPVIYYTVGQLWKLFGHHEFIFRLINLLIVFTGLFALFRVAEDLLLDSFWAIISVLFLFTSPILAYYSNNFLADAPAFGLALIGWYFFYNFYKKKRTLLFWISMFFFLAAGLIKISAAISFIAVLSVFFLELFQFSKNKNEKIFNKPLLQIIPFIVVILLWGLWYSYSKYYNNLNDSQYFLVSIFPIWKLDLYKIRDITDLLINSLLPQYFNSAGLNALSLLFFILLINYKKINRFLFTVTLLVSIGVLCYIILFYQAFDVHDYYLVNLLVLIPAIILTTLSFLKDNFPAWLELRWMKIGAGFILVYFIFYCALQTKIRYTSLNVLPKYSIFFQKNALDYWNWWNWHYTGHTEAFETVAPYLRSIGIEPNDKVIVTPDPSPNSMLYLMEQKGFSNFFLNGIPGDQRIKRCLELGAKYLIISETDVYKDESIAPFLEDKIGTFKNIDIYSLSQFSKVE